MTVILFALFAEPLPAVQDSVGQVKALMSYVDQEVDNELCVLEALKALTHVHQQLVRANFPSRPKSPLNESENDPKNVTNFLSSLCNAILQNIVSDDVCEFGLRSISYFVKWCTFLCKLISVFTSLFICFLFSISLNFVVPVKGMPELREVSTVVVKCLQVFY